ncbi:MAG TPA: ABC transporter permease [Anaerolineales bacterium]|nr:ABC transporter permease [Anaerolineales bacterium]
MSGLAGGLPGLFLRVHEPPPILSSPMLSYLSRRLFFLLLVATLTIFAVYLGMGMIQNSEIPQPDYNVVGAAQQAWGNTRAYLERLVTGDLGSVQEQAGPISVGQVLAEAYVNSMGLLLAALGVAALVGISIGVIAALTKHKGLVVPLLFITIIGISVPSFFGGLLLRQGELTYLRLFGRPLVSMAGFGWDYQHMLLPVLVLAARPLAYLTRATFLGMDRVMQEDYIRTAYSKGLSRSHTVNAHAVRNIAIPLVTAIGVSLRFALSTLPVVEFFFVWPGMGLRLLQAIEGRQTLIVVTLAAAMALTFLGMNFLLDISYRYIDPRVRGEA